MPNPPEGYPLAAAISPRVQVVETTDSTNADVVRHATEAPADWPHLSLELTTDQRAGRGRLDREWTAPPGTALAVSVLVRVGGHPAARAGVGPAGRGRRDDARGARADARHRAQRGTEVAERRAAGRRQALRHPRGGRARRSRRRRHRRRSEHPDVAHRPSGRDGHLVRVRGARVRRRPPAGRLPDRARRAPLRARRRRAGTPRPPAFTPKSNRSARRSAATSSCRSRTARSCAVARCGSTRMAASSSSRRASTRAPSSAGDVVHVR